jgi:hypothetical protein
VSDSPKRTLVVGAELTLETDDTRIEITTADGRLYVESDDLDGLWALYRLVESIEATGGHWLEAIAPRLEASNRPLAVSVPVVVRVDGVTVGRYTPGGAVGPLGRLLGGRPIRASPVGIGRSVVQWIRTAVGGR